MSGLFGAFGATGLVIQCPGHLVALSFVNHILTVVRVWVGKVVVSRRSSLLAKILLCFLSICIRVEYSIHLFT